MLFKNSGNLAFIYKFKEFAKNGKNLGDLVRI